MPVLRTGKNLRPVACGPYIVLEPLQKQPYPQTISGTTTYQVYLGHVSDVSLKSTNNMTSV